MQELLDEKAPPTEEIQMNN